MRHLDLIHGAGNIEPRLPAAIDVRDFLARKLPPREWVAEGLLQRRDLAMLHAWRGIGKTYFVVGLAAAIACGRPFLRWPVRTPRGVLLVDGEMPREDLQERLRDVVGDGDELQAPLRLLAADLCQENGDGLPSLGDEKGRAAVEANLGDEIELVILDSLATLYRGGGDSNTAEWWAPMQEWLLHLRRAGKTVLFVHHDGKAKTSRGTSAMEDVAAQVVHLTRPGDYRTDQGARFEVHLEKARGVTGAAALPFEAWLQSDPEGGSAWTTRTLEDTRDARIIEMQAEGYSYREIAREVGCGVGTVSRVVKRTEG